MAAAVLVVFVALVAGVLGWGYWHASSYAALHVALYDVALKTDRQAYGEIRAADIALKDETGAVLANARADGALGIVSIAHPTLGDCRREEQAASSSQEAMKAWDRCFAAKSRWTMTWVRRVRYAGVSAGDCRIDRTPAVVEESRDKWWLWWVPSPHIGGQPYTHFNVNAWIDSRHCRPVSWAAP